jgi:hypothetical protein
MGRHIIWLKTECKRAVAWICLAVKRAAILAIGIIAVACMVAFCTSKYYKNRVCGRWQHADRPCLVIHW